MREDELRKHVECTICKQRVGGGEENNYIQFYTVTIQPHIFNIPALKRNAGLVAMMDGHAEIARVMGADEELTHDLPIQRATICMSCLDAALGSIMEAAIDDDLVER